MGRPRRHAKGSDSPAVTKAKQIKKKYSPSKPLRARRALLAIEKDKVKPNEPLPSMETDSSSDGRTTIVLEHSVIKGYHAFKIKPPVTEPPTKLRIDREYTNIEDKDACLVWIPELCTFERKFHSLVTDHGRQLKLSDVAGLPIGRVPRVLASCFYTILDNSGEICAICNGDPSPSFPPWPSTQEKGGGIVIPCSYILTVTDTDNTVQMLTDTLSSMPEGSAMNIVIENM